MSAKGVISLFYWIIAILCVGASGWSTYAGFRSSLGVLAPFVSIAVSLGLLVCNIVILQMIFARRSFWAPVLGLLFFTAVTVASNFTYFYSLAMRDRVADDRVVEARRVFDENLRVADNALASLGGFDQRSEHVHELLRSLRYQVMDGLNPGFGPEARALLDNIYVAMPEIRTRTALPALGSPARANSAWLDAFDATINAELGVAARSDVTARARATLNGAREQQTAIAAATGDLSATAFETKVMVVDRMAEASSLVERALNQAGAEVDLRTVSSEGMRLHDIAQVFRIAFIERPLEAIVAVLLFFAAFVDFIPLVVAIVIRSLGLEEPVPNTRRKRRQARPGSGRGPIVLGESD